MTNSQKHSKKEQGADFVENKGQLSRYFKKCIAKIFETFVNEQTAKILKEPWLKIMTKLIQKGIEKI